VALLVQLVIEDRMASPVLKDPKAWKERKAIEVYPVCLVKKVTEDDPVNQECPAIPVCPVFPDHKDRQACPAVMVATEQRVKVVDLDSPDSPAVPVNLVCLDNAVQRVTLHKLYPDSKAKLEKPDLPVSPVMPVFQELLVSREHQVRLAILDVMVPKVTVVHKVSQACPEQDFVVPEVKRESQDHRPLIVFHLNHSNNKATPVSTFHHRFPGFKAKREPWDLKEKLARSVSLEHLVKLVRLVWLVKKVFLARLALVVTLACLAKLAFLDKREIVVPRDILDNRVAQVDLAAMVYRERKVIVVIRVCLACVYPNNQLHNPSENRD
jgi:hypothetical protein